MFGITDITLLLPLITVSQLSFIKSREKSKQENNTNIARDKCNENLAFQWQTYEFVRSHHLDTWNLKGSLVNAVLTT